MRDYDGRPSVPNGSGFCGSGDISVIQTGINGIMVGMAFTNDTAQYWRCASLIMERPPNGTPVGRAIAGVNNGLDGQRARSMHYPLSPVSNAPEKWPSGVPPRRRDVTDRDVAVQRDRTMCRLRRFTWISKDPYQVRRQTGEIVSRMLRAPDFDPAELINSERNHAQLLRRIDFFNTAHRSAWQHGDVPE